MGTLNELLDKKNESGVFLLKTNKSLETVKNLVEKIGYAFFQIDGNQIDSKLGFYEAISIELNFPSYFGMNLDALYDCLVDLSWYPAPGHVILYTHFEQFAAQNMDHFILVINTMADAAKDRNTVMYVLLEGDEGKLPSSLADIVMIIY